MPTTPYNTRAKVATKTAEKAVPFARSTLTPRSPSAIESTSEFPPKDSVNEFNMNDQGQEDNLDNTIAGIRRIPAPPARPSYVHPEIFDPAKGISAPEFLENYLQAAEANNWDERLKLMYFPSHLRGHAAAWFRIYARDHEDATWDDVKEEFIAAFFPKNFRRELKRKLKDRYQRRDEDLHSYYWSVVSLCEQVDENMAEEDVMDYVIEGMLPRYQEKIALGRTKTLKEMRELIELVTRSERDERWSQRDLGDCAEASPNLISEIRILGERLMSALRSSNSQVVATRNQWRESRNEPSREPRRRAPGNRPSWRPST